MQRHKSAFEISNQAYEKLMKEHPEVYQKCRVCGKRVIKSLCDDTHSQPVCSFHCPKHKWQSTYDWPTECGVCGVQYIDYLEKLLEIKGISYQKARYP